MNAITDQSTLETASLYALDLLGGAERDAFERRLGAEPALAACVDEFREAVAAVALTAPPAAPPPRVLADVLVRISDEESGGSPRSLRARLRRFPIGWAAAAGLAALLAVSLLHDPDKAPNDSRRSAADALSGAGGAGAAADPGALRAATARSLLDEIERELLRTNGGASDSDRRRSALSLVQDVERLRDEVSQLRRARDSRFMASPNLARTVVIELRDPSAQDSASDSPEDDAAPSAVPLSDRVSELIATAIEEEAAGIAGEDQPAGDSANASDGSVSTAAEQPSAPAESAAPGDSAPADPQSTLSSDAITEAFKVLAPGVVFDQQANTLWIESSEPGTYLEHPLPPGFDYDEFEDFAPELPAPGASAPPSAQQAVPDKLPLPAIDEPVIASAVKAAAASDAGPAVPDAPPAAAYSIYDETTGKGSIVVANLPPLGAEESFQLWLRNGADGKLVNVGALPESPRLVERFEFTLESSGISPAGFLLTRESAAHAARPSSSIVLQGP